MVRLSFGQTEKPANKIVTEKFVKNYNRDDYGAIFVMFAEVMQKALPQDKTTEFLKSLKAQAGNITHREFLKYENGSYASYKTNFERAVFILDISIDDRSKINGLLVKPFVEEKSLKTVINNLPVKKGIITKKQSELIFKYSKAFPNRTQIAIAVINNGSVGYYGIKKSKDTISYFDNHRSVFEIGSISKIFTATLLANFVIESKVQLNDYVNDYLNIPFNHDKKISFISLANHTSGLPRLPSNLDLLTADPKNPYKGYNETELEEYLTKYLELSAQGAYRYSNLGAGLIAYTLCKTEGQSYDRLLYTKIFSKYDMLSSTTKPEKFSDKLVKGLDASGKEVPNWEFSVLAGAGGILSTVEDLSKFVLAQFDSSNRELALTRQKTFELNNNMSIGLAWHIVESKSGSKLFWHNGGTGGYSSSMAIDTKRKNGIIILSNVSAFNPDMGNIDKLCFSLIETLEKE